MKKALGWLLLLGLLLLFSSCQTKTSPPDAPTLEQSEPASSSEAAPSPTATAQPSSQPKDHPTPAATPQEETAMEKLKIEVNGHTLLATWETNSSAEALQELLRSGPVTIEMHDYGNFEKVGPLGVSLPQNDEQITTAPGDVILYQGDQITIYYDVNSWSFTRLAKIDDPADLKAVLGSGSATVTFSLG